MRAYAPNLGHRALTNPSRARLAGLATIAALLLMGLFAGAAQASSVSNVAVDNTSPSAAVGARTVYFVSFTTSATGGLSRANNDSITVTFPSGTDITSALGNTSVIDVDQQQHCRRVLQQERAGRDLQPVQRHVDRRRPRSQHRVRRRHQPADAIFDRDGLRVHDQGHDSGQLGDL